MPAVVPERAERTVFGELAALRKAVRIDRKMAMRYGEIVVRVGRQRMDAVRRRMDQVILRRHVAKTRAVRPAMRHRVDRRAITVGKMRHAMGVVEVRAPAMSGKMRNARTTGNMWRTDARSVEMRAATEVGSATATEVGAATAAEVGATATAKMRSAATEMGAASATTEMRSAATTAPAATATATALVGGQNRGCHAERKADRDRYRARCDLPLMRAFQDIPPSQMRTGSQDS